MRVPQYARIKCPNCGCYSFKFLGIARVCTGLYGCGWVWDPGDAGRAVVGYRETSGQ